MSEHKSRAFPTNHISREDLTSVDPKRKATVDTLTDAQMEQIAHDIGEAISDTFWIAVSIGLRETFHLILEYQKPMMVR